MRAIYCNYHRLCTLNFRLIHSAAIISSNGFRLALILQNIKSTRLHPAILDCRMIDLVSNTVSATRFLHFNAHN